MEQYIAPEYQFKINTFSTNDIKMREWGCFAECAPQIITPCTKLVTCLRVVKSVFVLSDRVSNHSCPFEGLKQEVKLIYSFPCRVSSLNEPTFSNGDYYKLIHAHTPFKPIECLLVKNAYSWLVYHQNIFPALTNIYLVVKIVYLIKERTDIVQLNISSRGL